MHLTLIYSHEIFVQFFSLKDLSDPILLSSDTLTQDTKKEIALPLNILKYAKVNTLKVINYYTVTILML